MFTVHLYVKLTYNKNKILLLFYKINVLTFKYEMKCNITVFKNRLHVVCKKYVNTI